MLETRKILVPVDFNEKSIDVALNYAVMLAKKFNLEINMLHVIEESGFFSKLFSSDDSEKIAEQIEEKLKQIAYRTAQKNNVLVNPMVARGRVAHKIDEIASLLNVSFIVIAASNHSEERGVGTNTNKLVQISNSPILVVRNPKFSADIKNILLPIDLVASSRKIVPEVVEAAKLSCAKVTLIGGIWNDSANKELEKKMEFILNQVQSYIIENGLECKTVFFDSLSSEKEFQSKICTYAQDSEMDLIIALGKDESSPDYYIGSNTLFLINCSPIPIMSIIPKGGGIFSVPGRI